MLFSKDAKSSNIHSYSQALELFLKINSDSIKKEELSDLKNKIKYELVD
jgi:hypothetical protein